MRQVRVIFLDQNTNAVGFYDLPDKVKFERILSLLAWGRSAKIVLFVPLNIAVDRPPKVTVNACEARMLTALAFVNAVRELH